MITGGRFKLPQWTQAQVTTLEFPQVKAQEKRSGAPGGHQVEQEPVTCPCHKEGEWHPGLH